MDKKSIAIITARGGSKRIPRKNIKIFCGKPIINYSIEAALQSGLFDEIMVSTDDEEIAEVAKLAGASVPFMRSAETASDYATTSDVLLEVFNKYLERGMNFEYACCIYPTAPFITAEKIRKGMELLREKRATCVVPVVAFSFPPQRSHIIKNGKLEMKWPENRNLRSQDLETLYHDCGMFYCYNVERFIAENGQVVDNIIPLIMSGLEVQDIDNIDDWEIAEIKYKILKEKGIL